MSSADGSRALPCTRAYAAGTPRRGGVLCGQQQGAALHPLGTSPQTPRCWRISISPAGGMGAFGASSGVGAVQTSLPKAGQAGRETEWIIYGLS